MTQTAEKLKELRELVVFWQYDKDCPAKAVAEIDKMLSTLESEKAQPAEPKVVRGTNCDDTGHVHSITGEWRGRCHCPQGAQPAEAGADEYDLKDAALAGMILTHLGYSTSPSMEPGADPRRESLAKKLCAWQARAALASAQPGMVMVPVEPTPEMIDAGRWSEYGEETSRMHDVEDDDVRAVWAAMLAAAGRGV